jgi:hypothetical protein
MDRARRTPDHYLRRGTVRKGNFFMKRQLYSIRRIRLTVFGGDETVFIAITRSKPISHRQDKPWQMKIHRTARQKGFGMFNVSGR